MKKTYFIALAILLFSSCTSSKKLAGFSKNNLIFGSGGGITGMTNEYILHFDGTIEKMNSLTNEHTLIKTISKQQSKKLFRQYLNNGLDTLDFSNRGNMSYFVGFKNDSLTKKIIWGGGDEPPLKARQIYNDLIELIKNQ